LSLQELLSSEVQHFIREHEHDDERALVLKHKTIEGIRSSLIAEQIACRRKAKEKLPLYYNCENVLYPPGVNLEQSSSEQTANYKSRILADLSKNQNSSAVDLTGGFGVDTFFLSKSFSTIDYVEPNEALLKIAQHNHVLLGASSIRYHHSTAEDFLTKSSQCFDLIFIDPSRRAANKTKISSLHESEPKIITLLPKILQHTNHLLIKTSPLLDLKQALKELSFVKEVFVVSVDNDCKELLFFVEKNFAQEPRVTAVNLSKSDFFDSFNFYFSEENALAVSLGDPLTYLYEPNASILKAGAFKSIANQFKIAKIQSSTHLYTSSSFLENFPGRVFKIEARIKSNSKDLLSIFPEGKANVTTRNYPLSVAELKKKMKLKDGGEKYLIGFSGLKEKYLVAASRLK
jgi:16S rRNA G966 N2-methylase RsmD